VSAQVYKTKDKKSVLGTYSIDKDGDTTLNDFGRYLVKDGALKFNKTVKVQKDSNGKPLGANAG
jgi:branched-chain amino acid transport system substrate-binding protein